jgi:hypothetical protein
MVFLKESLCWKARCRVCHRRRPRSEKWVSPTNDLTTRDSLRVNGFDEVIEQDVFVGERGMANYGPSRGNLLLSEDFEYEHSYPGQ